MTLRCTLGSGRGRCFCGTPSVQGQQQGVPGADAEAWSYQHHCLLHAFHRRCATAPWSSRRRICLLLSRGPMPGKSGATPSGRCRVTMGFSVMNAFLRLVTLTLHLVHDPSQPASRRAALSQHDPRRGGRAQKTGNKEKQERSSSLPDPEILSQKTSPDTTHAVESSQQAATPSGAPRRRRRLWCSACRALVERRFPRGSRMNQGGCDLKRLLCRAAPRAQRVAASKMARRTLAMQPRGLQGWRHGLRALQNRL